MRFYNIITNEYPRYQGDLELLGWSLGDPLPENWVVVFDSNIPEVPENKKVYEGLPQKIDGVWVQFWQIGDLDIEASNSIPPYILRFSKDR